MDNYISMEIAMLNLIIRFPRIRGKLGALQVCCKVSQVVGGELHGISMA